MTDFFPPTVTGSAEHVRALARGLKRAGHQVSVATVAQKNTGPHVNDDDGYRIHHIKGSFQRLRFLYRNPSMRHHPPARDGKVTWSLKEVVQEERPDVIHTHGWIVHSAIPVKREFGLPLVHTLHDYGFICPKKSMLRGDVACNAPLTMSCIRCGIEQYGLWKSFLAYCGIKLNVNDLRHVDRFIAVSAAVKKAYDEYVGSWMSERSVVIPNFYDCEAIDSGVQNEAGSDDDVLPEDFILFVGNLIPAKGVDVLLEAFRRVNCETCLVIIGRRHPAYNYVRCANQRVVVLPDAPRELVQRAYSRCRFVVIPSLAPDPCPTVALEAMSHSKALIASDTGGLRDIVVDRETGILVQAGSVVDLIKAMESLFVNSIDASVMGQRGHERLRKLFSTKVIVPRIAQCYVHVLNSYGVRS